LITLLKRIDASARLYWLEATMTLPVF